MEKKESWQVNQAGEIVIDKNFNSGFVVRYILIHPGIIKRVETKNVLKATSLELSEAIELARRSRKKRAAFAAPDFNEIRLLDSLIVRLESAFIETLLPKEKRE